MGTPEHRVHMTGGPVTKEILILANSRKRGGRCVAGIDITNGRWVRPVSDSPHGEVLAIERRYRDGSEPKLLDVVSIPLLRRSPSDYQTENWLLDPDYYWGWKRTDGPESLESLVDDLDLWPCNAPETRFDLNNRVSIDEAASLTDSLRLIRVRDLRFRLYEPGAGYEGSKRRVQASFTHQRIEYRARVTDPTVERDYLARQDGWYDVGDAYLTVSLGEPWEGYVYKLVAGVILG